MAQSYSTPDGELIIPGAYAKYTVNANPSGAATTGVIALVGEADAGLAFSEEDDIASNFFGPEQLAEVVAKYKSGRLVDAFAKAVTASADAAIVGAPSRIFLLKTNVSTQASANLLKPNASTYAALAAKLYGKDGNLIYFSVADSVSETVPTTGSFAFIPNVGTVNAELRVNGGSALSLSLSANRTPVQFVSAVDALSGVGATGGTLRTVIPAGAVSDSSTLAVVASGNNVVITLAGATTEWETTPSVGDTLTIATGSAIAGAADANVGGYIVTAADDTTISATKKTDAGKGGASPGTVTAPVNVSAQDIAATTDLNVYAPVVISVDAGDVVDGVGKTLEIADLATGTDLLSRSALTTAGAAVTWISVAATPTVIQSAAEYKALLSVNRQSDAVQESIAAGGRVALNVGYDGTTASLTITETDITTSVTGGSGANLALKVADFATVADLVAYLNAQTGYTASSQTTSLGQTAVADLDRGTFSIASTHGAKTGRIKRDAVDFFNAVSNGSSVVQLGTGATPERADAGLPDTKSVTFLSGGAKGASTDALFTSALAALEKISCNFVVPLVSQDASADIALAETESTSSYTIEAVNAAVKTHVLAMSTLKRSRARQGLVSYRGTYANAKTAAGAAAHQRIACSFEDIRTTTATGSIKQFQPWMGAVVAAGMQAAGGYRAIFNKAANINGALQAAGDWDGTSQTDVEDALQNGLLPITLSEDGGYKWVSDQTTYQKDSNFVYNSLQAMYSADVVSATVQSRMKARFVGESLADVSAGGALSFFEGVMRELLRLKLIAPSVDAPLGFKNVRITISGPVMTVSFEVKLATALYFIPITFSISQVEQAA